MLGRLCFALIVLFWVAMNVLLWQAEFGPGRELGSAVPERMVWERILTAPDDSSMEIRRNGRRIGYCRWLPTPSGASLDRRLGQAESRPEGMVREISGYTVSLEGNVLIQEPSVHFKFNLQAQLATNRTWLTFTLQLAVRPSTWEIQANATNETVVLRWAEGKASWERTFTFAELRDPRMLLSEFEGPAALALTGLVSSWPKPGEASLAPAWQARTDWLKVSGARVRAYRLEAPLWDRHRIVIVINRVGEIMRVELPGGLSFANDLLLNL
jgi:hypothetical protein